MLSTKERIFGFLVILLCMSILFGPARGYCVTLKGRVLKTNNDDLEKAFIFLCDYEAAKLRGIQATVNIVGMVATTQDNNNLVAPAKTRENIVLDETKYPLDREYLLGISTLTLHETQNYPSFFRGGTTEENLSNPGNFVNRTRWWDLETLPRVRFTSGTFNLGTVIAPGTGVWFRGLINDENGDFLTDVGVELYWDSNGVPTQIPFPFTCFVRTDEEDSDNLNFQIGGVLKNVPYYVKLIASNTGYQDTYIMDNTNPDEPRLFNLNGNYNNPPYNLTEQGAQIWGYIKDIGGNPVTDAVTSVQGLSDNEEDPYPIYYVRDPNYEIYSSLTDIDRYLRRVEPYYYNCEDGGRYEINGLPYLGHNFYLSLVEVPGGAPKRYATPNWYNGSIDGVFDIDNAETISFTGPGDSVRVDFNLNEGACIKGNIGLQEVISAEVRSVLADLGLDPNIFNADKVGLVAEAFKVNSDGTLSSMPYGGVQTIGVGPYDLCGLPPMEGLIRFYALNGLYPPLYHDGAFGTTIPLTAEIISLDFGSQVLGKDINLALGVMLEGQVKDPNDQPVSGASVVVNQVNLGNPLVGYFFINSEGAPLAQYSKETDPNGRFYLYGLPEGLYTIFVNGIFKNESTGYLPQFYTTDSRKTMIANETTPLFFEDNNPDFVLLNEFQLKESGTSGGIISGNISLSTNVSSMVTLSSDTFFLRLFKADMEDGIGVDPGLEISNPLYQFGDPVDNMLPYQIMVPDFGDYILSVQDKELKLVPHFYRVEGTTVNYNNASILTISSSDTLLEAKNVVLSEKSGKVSGEVLDDSKNQGISGIIVHASQQITDGPQAGTWRSVRQTETDSNGEFILKGLYKGTYIFSVTDPDNIFAARYYTTTGQDPYIPDNADTWTYNPSTPDTPYFSIRVQEGGRISGIVNNQNKGTKLYGYRIKEGNTVGGYSVTADPNFFMTGLIPGDYILGYKDPNLNYVPMYYSQGGFTTDLDLDDPNFYITVEIDETTEVVGEMSFTQLGARVEGQIWQETGTSPEPMLNTYVFAYYLTDKKAIWATTPAQFTATDSEGNYSLKGLSKGNYKIIAFGPQYRPIAEFITILESDLGPGPAKQVDLTFPLDWPDTNMKYDKTLELEQGLNLIAYPTRIPPYVTGYTSLSLLKDIVMVSSRAEITLETFSHYDQKWKTASFGKTELEGLLITDVHGSNYSVSNGQGFLLYSEEGPTINFRYFPGQTSLWLKKGINVVGNVAFKADQADINETDFTPDPDFTTRKMLSKMGEDSSVSIQTFEAREGKWKATYWMWGKSAGKDTEVKDELGYIVTMKEDVNNWYPADNN